VAQTFLNIPALQQYVRMDSIITVVDAEQIEKQMKDSETAREQVSMADFLLLNKTDLVSAEHLDRVEAKARELNPHATIFRTSQSQANLKEILDMNAFKLDQKLSVDPEFLNELNTRHHHDIQSFSFEFDKPFNVEKFESSSSASRRRKRCIAPRASSPSTGNPRRAIFHGVNNRSRSCGTASGKRRDAHQPASSSSAKASTKRRSAPSWRSAWRRQRPTGLLLLFALFCQFLLIIHKTHILSIL